MNASAPAAHGMRLLGPDISGAMLRTARAALALAGRLVLCDPRTLPIAGGRVDGAWADGSLHHLLKPVAAQAVCEAARTLKRGGILCTSVERGDFEGHVERQEGVAGRRWHRHSFYRPEALRAQFRAAGIDRVDEVIGGSSEHSAGYIFLIDRRP